MLENARKVQETRSKFILLVAETRLDKTSQLSVTMLGVSDGPAFNRTLLNLLK